MGSAKTARAVPISVRGVPGSVGSPGVDSNVTGTPFAGTPSHVTSAHTWTRPFVIVLAPTRTLQRELRSVVASCAKRSPARASTVMLPGDGQTSLATALNSPSATLRSCRVVDVTAPAGTGVSTIST